MNNKNHIRNLTLKISFAIFVFILSVSNIYATSAPKLYSKNAILVDNDSGKVLFEMGKDVKVYPASTTKVLTAILTLEKLDISSSTVVTETAVKLPYGSSNAALKQGEVMSIKDLLYALMLQSGNDAANVLAEAVSGNIDEFVVLMNNKLSELGCTNSHFTNAHGYHDDNHYTTPSDMMKLLSYAIKNEQFVEIFSTASYTIEPTNKTKTKREYQNTNRLILTKKDSYLSRYYEYCVGGKTGYTDEAGRTLIAYAKKDDKNLLLGVFNSNPSGVTDLRYTDSINLFEYGFNNYEKVKLLDKKDYSFSYSNKDKKVTYSYSLDEDIYALSNNDETSVPAVVNYTIDLDYNELNKYDITTKDYANQVVGKISIAFRQNSTIYDKEFDLVLNNISEIEPTLLEKIADIFSTILIIVFCILVLLLIVLLNKFSRKSKKQKKAKKDYISTNSNSRRKVAYKSRRTLK